MAANIFILGLDEFQLGELQTIRKADERVFHNLLDVDRLTMHGAGYSFKRLLEEARQQLECFPGSIDAVIAHWDFPTSIIAPVLCREYEIASPSLESVLKCEHKYWSRLEQQKVIPGCIPGFNSFDPFDANALERIELEFPFWIKPVKSFASQLGFKIHDVREFQEALAEIQGAIGDIGGPFDEALTLIELPEEIRGCSGRMCIAEEIIAGEQFAIEGSMFQGEYQVHGALDMPKDAAGRSFERYDYPSALPERVQRRMIDSCGKFLRHIGFDNGCFNAEYLWEKESDKLRLVEINTRISQSHSDLFAKVDGMSNHEVAIDVALGTRPRMPHREGKFRIAAKCMIPHYEDGIVTRVPSRQELAQIEERFPDTHVQIDVEPGRRLAELPNQDSYRYVLGTIFLGADSREQLLDRLDTCLDTLQFEFTPAADSP
ncbi:MAG TPA: ATP-grasp domain-containing protein [Nitrococcus sp.]|nr:ATP-grasp domain-containing protein [Nitrococcus sp.]